MSVQNQLFEAVYYGADLEFKYSGNYYFINSGKIIQDNSNAHSITVYKSKNLFMKEKITIVAWKFTLLAKKMQMTTRMTYLKRKFLKGSHSVK